MEIFDVNNYTKDISENEIMVVNCNDLEVDSGAVYGFLSHSASMIWNESSKWLCVDSGAYLSLFGKTRVISEKKQIKNFFICVKNEKPFFHLGYLQEGEGMLKYIDGCTDSLLISPVKRGMPCLNHLHFPPNTRQTFHTHPSYRAGIVAYGHGVAETEKGEILLSPGLSWFIPANEKHRFKTDGSDLGVVAYHPDSDFGPVDENHPMINRTII